MSEVTLYERLVDPRFWGATYTHVYQIWTSSSSCPSKFTFDEKGVARRVGDGFLRGQQMPYPRPWKVVRSFHSESGPLRAVFTQTVDYNMR